MNRGRSADAKAIIAHYKCPRSGDIHLEPLPFSAAGKVLKRELRVEYLARKQAANIIHFFERLEKLREIISQSVYPCLSMIRDGSHMTNQGSNNRAQADRPEKS